MNGSKTRKLRRELGVSKPGRKNGQLAKAVVVGVDDRTSGNKFLGTQKVNFGEQVVSRLQAMREQREANRAALAAQNAAKAIEEYDVESPAILGSTSGALAKANEVEDKERARKDEKNRKVREARALKAAALKASRSAIEADQA